MKIYLFNDLLTKLLEIDPLEATHRFGKRYKNQITPAQTPNYIFEQPRANGARRTASLPPGHPSLAAGHPSLHRRPASLEGAVSGARATGWTLKCYRMRGKGRRPASLARQSTKGAVSGARRPFLKPGKNPFTASSNSGNSANI